MKVFTFTLILIFGLLSGCSSTTEAQTNEPDPMEWVTYEAADGPGQGKYIVLVSGDEEYRSEEALPQLAKILTFRHGFKTTVLFAQDPAMPGIVDPNYLNNIPGLEMLEDADLMVLFTRFRALPDEQMTHIQDYLMEGNPIIGIRTSTHAFETQDTSMQWKKWSPDFREAYLSSPSSTSWTRWSNFYKDESSAWDGGFGRLVLGENWVNHHGHHKHQSTRGLIADGARDHPITRGLEDGDIWGPTDVYGIRLPMQEAVTPIILGQVINRAGEFDENDPYFGLRPTDSEVATTNPRSRREYNPNDPMMPIAWTKSYQLPGGQAGMSFTSTIGASTDMANEGVRHLFVNAAYYLLDMEVPAEANVDIVGEFNPSAYNFHSDEYWEEQNIEISGYAYEESGD